MIKIINNFFEKEDLKKVQDFALNKAFYTPRFFDDAKVKNEYTHYGDRFLLKNNPELFELIKKQAEIKFKIKIKKINLDSGIDLRNLNHFKPHSDLKNPSKINILIMISGPTAVTNGTVFYESLKDGGVELDTHIGFRENRAIFFPSDKIHSQHASNVSNLRRYTSTLFVEDYTEV